MATVVQLVLIPVLQPILGSTSLVNVDLYLFGPIGDPQTMTTVTAVGQTVSGLNPYYVFNFTGGPVNTLVTRTLNGITGSYLTHGGVAYFLATFIPLILSQVVSFFLQRKVTFKSSGNIAWQAMWYFAAFLVITVGANALYRIYQPWLYSTLGEAIGGLIAAFLQCCIAFWHNHSFSTKSHRQRLKRQPESNAKAALFPGGPLGAVGRRQPLRLQESIRKKRTKIQ